MLESGNFSLIGLCLVFLIQVQAGQDFERPFQVKAGSETIDVEVGHAAPWFADFDGDGLKDLLVGQFGGGRLRIYRNLGAPGDPMFGDFYYFQAAGADGTVPAS